MPRAHELHKRNQVTTPGDVRYTQWGPKLRTGRAYFIRYKPNPGFAIPWFGKRLHWCKDPEARVRWGPRLSKLR